VPFLCFSSPQSPASPLVRLDQASPRRGCSTSDRCLTWRPPGDCSTPPSPSRSPSLAFSLYWVWVSSNAAITGCLQRRRCRLASSSLSLACRWARVRVSGWLGFSSCRGVGWVSEGDGKWDGGGRVRVESRKRINSPFSFSFFLFLFPLFHLIVLLFLLLFLFCFLYFRPK